MIIWHRRDKYFNKDGGVCFKKKDSSEKDSKSKKNKDDKDKAKKQKEKEKEKEKEKREKQEKADKAKKEKDKADKEKAKAEKEKNKVKPPPEKKKGKEEKKPVSCEPKKKSYNSIDSSGSDIISSSPTEKPSRLTYIPASTRMRNATEPNLRPPDNKKFSISRKGRTASNDPLAQRLALARGVSLIYFRIPFSMINFQ